jgi:Flp pilus assembly pilin Flp
MTILSELWVDDQGQDIAEYAVMLAAILVIVIGTDTASRFRRQQRFFSSRQFDPIELSLPCLTHFGLQLSCSRLLGQADKQAVTVTPPTDII